MGEKRLDTTFHRTFTLVRPAVAEVLQVVSEAGPGGTESLPDLLKTQTPLGSIYIEAMPRFAIGSGLLTGLGEKRKSLTDFGRLMLLHDPYLNNPATLWLMHYHLSAPNGPGPTYWNYLVSRSIRIGDLLETNEVAKEVAFHVKESTGKSLTGRAPQTSATAFLGTYAKYDGLGPLGILQPADGPLGGTYRVGEPARPPLWVLAYVLAAHWDAFWGAQKTVSLAWLTEPGALASLFLLGSDQLVQMLEELRREGELDLFRDAPPYQVARLGLDQDRMLERLYE